MIADIWSSSCRTSEMCNLQTSHHYHLQVNNSIPETLLSVGLEVKIFNHILHLVENI